MTAEAKVLMNRVALARESEQAMLEAEHAVTSAMLSWHHLALSGADPDLINLAYDVYRKAEAKALLAEQKARVLAKLARLPLP